MTGMAIAIVALAALAVLSLAGAGFLWMDRRRLARELAAKTDELRSVGERAGTLATEAATLRARADGLDRQQREQAATLDALHQRFQDTFDALAGKALESSSRQFLDLAKKTFEAEHERAKGDLEARRKAVDDLLKPIGEALRKTDEQLRDIERQRVGAYAGLREQVEAMQAANRLLTTKAGELVTALRRPEVRGAAGEMQLRRVAEAAGMKSYCDFVEQDSRRTDAGSLRRPDMIVRLPNDRLVAVDAKTNTDAYLSAAQAATPEEADAQLERFARHVADTIASLSRREYWESLPGSPELVVMFLPFDQLLDAALQRRPDLLDVAARQRVVLASPSTLIALLRAIEIGWREKNLADNARELFELGRTLHQRAAVAFEHLGGLGASLRQAVDRYNKVIGSVETNLRPALARFEEAGAKSGKEMPETPQIEVVVREGSQLLGAPARGRSDGAEEA